MNESVDVNRKYPVFPALGVRWRLAGNSNVGGVGSRLDAVPPTTEIRWTFLDALGEVALGAEPPGGEPIVGDFTCPVALDELVGRERSDTDHGCRVAVAHLGRCLSQRVGRDHEDRSDDECQRELRAHRPRDRVAGALA